MFSCNISLGKRLETKLINGCNLIAGFGNVSERADVRADAICSK